MKKISFTWEGMYFESDSYVYRRGSPGKLSGPPETCYPPEPAELEDLELKVEPYEGELQAVPDIIVSYLLDNESFFETVLDTIESLEDDSRY